MGTFVLSTLGCLEDPAAHHALNHSLKHPDPRFAYREGPSLSVTRRDASFTLGSRRLYMGGSGASIVFVEDSKADKFIAWSVAGAFVSNVFASTMAP